MNRYLLFKGNDYYPCGGWNDFSGFFASIEDAKSTLSTELYDGSDWWHIVDSQTMQVVEKDNEH